MITKNKKITGLILFLFLGLNLAEAQIYKTRSDIINMHGYDYTSEITDSGVKYMLYTTKDITKSRTFFFKNHNGTEIVFRTGTIGLASDLDIYIDIFQSKYVKIGYMKWKDYEANMIYEIELKGGFCVITISHDI
jgi:hypothetical protein